MDERRRGGSAARFTLRRLHRYPDLEQARPFAACPDQDAVIKGPQLRAVQWLIEHGFPGVLAASTVLADGQLWSSSASVRFFDAPYGARVGVTEAGPTLWVPGSFESARYVPAFTHFLAFYGWSGDYTDGEFDVTMSCRARPTTAVRTLADSRPAARPRAMSGS